MKFVAKILGEGSARHINDSGIVTGYVGASTAAQKAFVTVNDVMTVIPITAYNSQGVCVGPDNEVVGTATNPSRYGVFGWRQEGAELTVLPGLGGTVMQPAYTNGNIVVGQASLPSRVTRAFKHENGRTEDIGTLGGPGAVASCVNANGTIVGSSRISDADRFMRPFIYKNGSMSQLGAPNAVNGWCYGVNNSDDAVGLDNGVAVLYRGSTTKNLSTVPAAAFSINDAGLVVGSLRNGMGCAMLWANGREIALPDVTSGLNGIQLVTANSINNHNEIACIGLQGSKYMAIVLEPTES